MPSWGEFEAEQPAFAERVRTLLSARRHLTVATIRRDGSPRISGTEVEFRDGELLLGMMPGSVKARDLLRDGRLALHGPSVDPPEEDPSVWAGDAKLAGLAVRAERPGDAPVPGVFFRVDVTEAVVTSVGTPADHLVIESWHPGRGYRRRERR